MSGQDARGKLVERSKREVLLLAAPMIERTVHAAITSIDEAQRVAQSGARRFELGDALAALQRHAQALQASFPKKLVQGVAQALEGDADFDAKARRNKEANESLLALVDDAEVSRFVEAARLEQTTLPVVEKMLAKLDSLMSSAMGLPTVRAELNPYRPQVMCAALMQVLEEAPVSTDLRNHWIRHMAVRYAVEVRDLYEALATLLKGQGVQEARYRVRLATPSGARGAGAAGLPPGAGPGHAMPGQALQAADAPIGMGLDMVAGWGAPMPPMNRLYQARPDVGAAVIQDFLYHPQWIEAHDEPLPRVYYQGVEGQLAALMARQPPDDLQQQAQALAQAQAQRQSLGVLDRPVRHVNAEQTLPPEQWGQLASAHERLRTLMQLKAKAERVAQVLGLDAVRTLINQVGSDGRLLAPVREAFVALEPALLHLAMEDPRFFGDDNHPARALIEAVAQRSFKYNDEFSREFEHFMEPVRRAVRELAALPRVQPKDFEARRKSLESIWESEDERDKTTQMEALESMQFIQERQRLAERISQEFGLRSDLAGAPAAVLDFLYRDWTLVVAHAQLASVATKSDRGRYLAVVSDLLWSVNREQVMKHPSRFFELVPNMVKTLRRGLEMLGKEEDETEAFFSALFRYHDPMLRLRRARSMGDTTGSQLTSSLAAPLPPPEADWAPATEFAPPKAEQPWMGRREREATGFADLSNLAAVPTIVSPPSGMGEPAPAPAPAQLAATVPADMDGDPVAVPAADAPADVAPDAAPDAAVAAPAQELSQEELRQHIQAQLSALRTGDWVDLFVNDVWRRARLTWVSDNGALFMFVSDGGRAHSMTRRITERLMRQRHLRPVDFDPVVERALQRFAGAAEEQAELEAVA